MAETRERLAKLDPVWAQLVKEAEQAVKDEPLLGGLVHSSVLYHGSLERALSYRISMKLASGEMPEQLIREICDEAYSADTSLAMDARADIAAVYDRDPACHSYLQPLMFFKGFNSIQAHRIAHWLWNNDRRPMALFIQSRVSERFAVDIHPAAKYIGSGVSS